MDSSEILARFGISEKLAYGLFIQSLFVIFALIINLWRSIEVVSQSGFKYIFLVNLTGLILAISLLIYSFYGFNAEKNQEAYYTASIIIYIIELCLLIKINFHYGILAGSLSILTLIMVIYFLFAYKKNYKSAQYVMLLTVIIQSIIAIVIVLAGASWYVALIGLIMPVTIALTHFERVQRGKYPNIL